MGSNYSHRWGGGGDYTCTAKSHQGGKTQASGSRSINVTTISSTGDLESRAHMLSQLVGGIFAQSNLSHGGILFETPYGQRKIGDHFCNITPAIQKSCDMLIAQGNHPAIAMAVVHHTPYDILKCASVDKSFRYANNFFSALRDAGFEQMYFLPLTDQTGQLYLASTASRERLLLGDEIRLIHSYCLEALDHLWSWKIQCPPKDSCSLLTPRERECLIAAAKGYTEKHTARYLGISPNTVHVHIENSKRKLGARNKLNAIFLGLQLREILDSEINSDD